MVNARKMEKMNTNWTMKDGLKIPTYVDNPNVPYTCTVAKRPQHMQKPAASSPGCDVAVVMQTRDGCEVSVVVANPGAAHTSATKRDQTGGTGLSNTFCVCGQILCEPGWRGRFRYFNTLACPNGGNWFAISDFAHCSYRVGPASSVNACTGETGETGQVTKRRGWSFLLIFTSHTH